MAKKRGGLGKGLDMLLTQYQQPALSKREIRELDVSKIKPNRWQPRRTFDESALTELAESIKVYGVLQPLIVRADGDDYELISGERRLRASKLAGLKRVPAIVRNFSDDQIREVAIIENVQRENLNPIEEARAYDRLISEFGYSKEDLATKIGCSVARLTTLIRLLKLAPTVQDLILDGQLTLTQALPLLAVDNPDLQLQTAELVISEKLSARKINAFINELKSSGLISALTESIEHDKPLEIVPDKVDTADKMLETNSNDPVVEELLDEPLELSNETDEELFFVRQAEFALSRRFGGRRVTIARGRRRNKIQIEFADIDDLLTLMKEFEQPLQTKEEKIAALRSFSTAKRGDKI